MIDLSRLLQKLFEWHGAIPRLLHRDGRAFLPIHLLLEVTYRCNLRCEFCQYLDIIEGKAKPFGPSPKDLPRADILRWIEEMPRGRLISFAGGETLVRKDFPQILRAATRRHRAHIITNGALIDEETARLYLDLAPRRVWQNGLVLVEVSLQGGEALHDRIVKRKGSWRQAVDGLRRMVELRTEQRKAYPKFDLKMVITAQTVGAMVDFMHLAKDLGVDIVNFLAEHDLVGNAEGGRLEHLTRPQRRPLGVDPAELREALRRCHALEKELGVQLRLTPNLPIDEFVRHYTDDRDLDPSSYACEGTWSRLAVGADGRYAPMCHYAATGDMRRESLREAWNNERFRTFRLATEDAGVYPACSGCCNLKYVGPKPFGLAGATEDLPVVSAAADDDQVAAA